MNVHPGEFIAARPSSPYHSLGLLWAPCIGTLLYLSGSLLLFKFGPIDWPVLNEPELWAFNVLYLSMFVVGYAIAFRQRHLWSCISAESQDSVIRFFWLIWTCAALVVLIGHRNLTLGPSYWPLNLLSDFLRGLDDPLGAYLYKLSDDAKSNFAGNLPMTLMFGVLAFSKLLLVHVLVGNWPTLSRPKRCLGTLVSIFPAISGVSVGTNKPVFDVTFVLITIFATHFVLTRKPNRLKFIKARLALVFLIAGVSVFAGVYFQKTMNVRAPGLDHTKSLAATAGSINLKSGYRDYCEDSNGWALKGCHLISIASIYLTQGYYGMSLSIDIPHETTYGLGHSKFVIDALDKYAEVDIAPRTFQYKVHDRWSATAQWHSAYSQWANDVGFLGVGLVMLFIGFYACAVWISAVITHNAAAICSIPLLTILVIFIPANNQVFNLFESLASFTVLLAAWVVSLSVRMKT